MQFAIDLPPFGPFSDPNLVAALVQEAEEAGWNGFFLWDHINYKLDGSPEPMAEHNSSLIVRTDRVTLIAMPLKGAASVQFSSSSGCVEREVMVVNASL